MKFRCLVFFALGQVIFTGCMEREGELVLTDVDSVDTDTIAEAQSALNGAVIWAGDNTCTPEEKGKITEAMARVGLPKKL